MAARRLSGAPDDAPLRVRIVRRDARLVTLTQTGFAQVDSTRPHVARDLAADVVRLLSSPAEIMDGDRRVPVRPGHLAILVPTNRQASLVRDALAEVGVSAVINGAGSVFGTRAADEWLRLLRAIERPASPSLAASAALTGFLGWTAVRLAEVDDADLEELHAHLHRLGAVLRARGVATLLETVATGTGLAARVLAERDGERTMTDLRHVGQLLHEAAAEGQLGVSALAAWLSERIAQAGQDTANEDRSRRLESDAEAVQVLTIHRSKGLEFPIVYCPFLWDRGRPPDRATALPVFHGVDDERTLDVGGPTGGGFAPHYALAVAEERGEDLRLAYVALTRARHQAVLWWAGSQDSGNSPLGRLLFSTDSDGNVATSGNGTPSDDEVWTVVSGLAAPPGCVSVEWTSEPPGTRWSPPATAPATLAAAPFDRGIDAIWRRSSYSSVTDGAEEEPVGSEPEQSSATTSRPVPRPRPRPRRTPPGCGPWPCRSPACPPGRSWAPSCTRCSSAPTSRRRIWGRAHVPGGRGGGVAGRPDRRPAGRRGGPPRRHRDPARGGRPPARPGRRGPDPGDGLRAAAGGGRRAHRDAAPRRHRRPPRAAPRRPATRSPPIRSTCAGPA